MESSYLEKYGTLSVDQHAGRPYLSYPPPTSFILIRIQYPLSHIQYF
jgi:hypothetical protein